VVVTARRLVVSIVLGAALGAPAGAAADTPITTLAAPTPVRAWAGTAVLSTQDPATGRYRLATQRGTAAPEPLPGIAPAAASFDADIGPGPGGAPVIVFARCPAPRRCHLSRTTPAGGTELPIAGAAATGGFESAPTIWGSRLAFARRYPSGSERVYVRPLTAGTQVRSTRLPGVPTRTCDEVTRCRTIRDGTVRELELRGSTLAENVHFGLATVGICGEGQLRLVDLARRTSRLVTHTLCGLSGSTLLGASLTATHLLYARICPGDPAGCGNHSTIINRYGLIGRRSEQVAERDLLTGFAALDDGHAIEVRAPGSHDGDCTNHIEGTSPTCLLALTGPLAFAPARR
jgi:hypothetical protein